MNSSTSLRNFFSTQRRKCVLLIYESLVERYQRFTQIMEFAEEVAKKSSQFPEDDSVEDSLRHLKMLLQFNFQDTSSQVDLALEQSAMRQHVQVSQTLPKIPFFLTAPVRQSHSAGQSLIVIEDECSTQLPSNGEFEVSTSHKNTQETIPTTTITKESPLMKSTVKEVNESPKQKNPIILQKPKHPVIQASSQSSQSTSSISFTKQSETTKSEQRRQPASKNIMSYFESYSAQNKYSSRSRFMIERATYLADKASEKKFIEYAKKIREFEDNHNFSLIPKFKDKEFYFLRTQNRQFPVATLLDNADKAMIVKLKDCFNTTIRAISRLLTIRPRLISKIIRIYKQGTQKKNKKLVADSEDEEEQEKTLTLEDDDEEEDEDEEEEDAGNDGSEEEQIKKVSVDEDENDAEEEINIKLKKMASGWSKQKVEQPFNLEGL